MAIIGISGKIGSGKDTVGKIIQYLTAEDKSPICIEKLTSGQEIKGYHNSIWEIKKFAAKLKQIVSVLTGIPVEDLEKEEVKNTVLEGWNVYELISNDAAYLNLNVRKIFATREEGLHWINNLVHISEKSHLNYGLKETELTVRYLLQLVGTDAMRNIIHPNIWVNALYSEYKDRDAQADGLIHEKYGEINVAIVPNPMMWPEFFPKWVITDVRFPNELEAVKRYNGISIRVARYSNKTSNHISETALDSATFDYYIDNSGSIENLIDKVREILKHANIIV
jgi:dephospho-CoA kinase